MSRSKSSYHISIKSQVDAIKKHKAEIQRLRGELYSIWKLSATTSSSNLGEIAKLSINGKPIHLHHTANELFVQAAKAAIPCLKDWIQTTGFGEVNRRDREVVALLVKAIERDEEEKKHG